jgi:hypothetical protein
MRTWGDVAKGDIDTMDDILDLEEDAFRFGDVKLSLYM